jgi:hypothetical protein
MDLALQGCLRLEHHHVPGQLKRRRRRYVRIVMGTAVLYFVLILALVFVPLFVLALAVPTLADQVWFDAAYIGLSIGVWVVVALAFAILIGRPLQRRLSGKMELVAYYESDDLRYLGLGHLQHLGQRKSTFDYVRRAWKGRELRDKLKGQLLAQGCLIEQERPASPLLRDVATAFPRPLSSCGPLTNTALA